MERAEIRVTGGADRVLALALRDLAPVFDALEGNVLIVGGVMARIWLHLRPIDEFVARATVDVDMGIDRQGLGLTANSRRVVPLLRELGYGPMNVPEEFRFEKELGPGVAIVDLLVPKGASRDEPPVLEQGVTTLAAPGLAYALGRGTVDTEVTFVDGDEAIVARVPLPTLDAAFVLKGALMESGVRRRPDRVQRDTVDAAMLATACARDDAALAGLAERRSSGEARKAIKWVKESFTEPRAAAATRVAAHLERQGFPDGARWAVAGAAYFARRIDGAR